MIYSIRGIPVVLTENTLCLEQLGIAWEIAISAQSYAHFKAQVVSGSENVSDGDGHELVVEQGSKVESMHETTLDLKPESKLCTRIKAYTYLHSNDKGMTLYGFCSLAERSMFLSLQKVDGIGPKAALKILSHSTPENLLQAIRNKDVEVLAKISGIGAKKAPKILLTLEGVYVNFEREALRTGRASQQSRTYERNTQDVIDGLVAMGYAVQEIERALENISLASVAQQDAQKTTTDEGTLMHQIILDIERPRVEHKL